MSEKPFIVDGNNSATKGDLIKVHWCCLIFLYSICHKCTKKKKIDQYCTISESNFCNVEKICFSDWNLEGAAICWGK